MEDGEGGCVVPANDADFVHRERDGLPDFLPGTSHEWVRHEVKIHDDERRLSSLQNVADRDSALIVGR